MAYNLAPVIKRQYFDSNGDPLAGGFVYTYQSGTTTPQATYTDSTGGTPNANPIVLDSSGECNMWLNSAYSYKFVVKNSSGSTLKTEDGVAGTLSTDSVITASILDGAVTTAKLADDSVTSAKLADDASVDANRAVTTNHIKDSAVTTAKIADSAVTLAKVAAAVQALLTPTGMISPYGGTAAPTGWLLCDGTLVSRTTYSALYTSVGTAFGSGDGSTTFALPDLRGKFLRGAIIIANVTGSGTAGSSNATFTAHGYNRTGTKVRLSSGTLSGLSTSTDYYVIVVDANTLAFATSKANALASTKIAISGSNSAVIMQYEDPDASTRAVSLSGGNTGAAVGSMQEDAQQGHRHTTQATGAAGGGSLNPTAFSTAGGSAWTIGDPVTDGTNGTPRTSGETRPSNVYVNYIIKT